MLLNVKTNIFFESAIQKKYPLRVRCEVDETTGKIYRKIEKTSGWKSVYNYLYDTNGHLFRVFRDGFLHEEYLYGPDGRRLACYNRITGKKTRYHYRQGGGLLCQTVSSEPGARFEYEASGTLRLREEDAKITLYGYKEARLQTVNLPGGDNIRYMYENNSPNPMGPSVTFYKTSAGEWPVMEYLWLDGRRLAACVDYQTGLQYEFDYEGKALSRIRLRGHAVRRLCRTSAHETELIVGCDQVNTPKIFTDLRGREIKRMDYDSFGMVLGDSLPELFIPVGFAGGLVSRYTGFVRFGYRDYDPATGRFTCPGFMGKTAGGSLSRRYSMDDPVNLKDPLDLFGMNSLAGRSGWKETRAYIETLCSRQVQPVCREA